MGADERDNRTFGATVELLSNQRLEQLKDTRTTELHVSGCNKERLTNGKEEQDVMLNVLQDHKVSGYDSDNIIKATCLTNDDACSMECKSELLEILKLNEGSSHNQVRDISSSGISSAVLVIVYGDDTWNYNQHHWSKKTCSLSTYEW
ncbi:hypothetical protein JHK82_030224 [Glycine max]|nr:hypothetical protein JHK82_030224 [Glycine max]